MQTPPKGYELTEQGLRPETVDLHITKVLKSTDKAILAVIEGRQHWIPFSQIMDPRDTASRAWDRDLEVTLWWVKQAGLEGY